MIPPMSIGIITDHFDNYTYFLLTSKSASFL